MLAGRRDFLRGVGLASPLLAAWGARAQEQTAVASRVAIQGVCAWPNLQRLADGTLLAVIFNQPTHGLWEGDLDCWASEDDGLTWRFRGRAAAHEPTTNRMNCAAGIASNGDVVVLSSGWAERGARDEPRRPFRQVLRPWVCRSSDQGKTWRVDKEFPAPPDSPLGAGNEFIPFGNIRRAEDGSLCVAVYLRRDDERSCYMLRSRDDGRSWGERVPLNPNGNETDILHLGEGRWLAASREFHDKRDVHIELFASDDDAKTWRREMPLTLPRQITGNLALLADGRVLLSYGNRCWNNFGVDARLSDDRGRSWSAPIRLADCPSADCGYPSSVQLPDGRVVTGYYTQVSPDYHYEMRVAHWRPDEFDSGGQPRG